MNQTPTFTADTSLTAEERQLLCLALDEQGHWAGATLSGLPGRGIRQGHVAPNLSTPALSDIAAWKERSSEIPSRAGVDSIIVELASLGKAKELMGSSAYMEDLQRFSPSARSNLVQTMHDSLMAPVTTAKLTDHPSYPSLVAKIKQLARSAMTAESQRSAYNGMPIGAQTTKTRDTVTAPASADGELTQAYVHGETEDTSVRRAVSPATAAHKEAR